MLKYASTQFTTSAPRRIFSSRRVHHAAAVGDVIATCVAHQYSIVKELDFVFQKPRLSTTMGSDSWILILWFDLLVGLGRIELPTSPLSGVRSSQLSYRPGHRHPWNTELFCGQDRPFQNTREQTGGAGRDRTGDLLNANQALS